MSGIDTIFKVLLVHYGGNRMSAFWQGTDPVEVKAYWSRKLSDLTQGQIDYGLRNLPKHPPTVDEFRDTAVRYRPEPAPLPMLGSPKNDEHGRERINALAERYGLKSHRQAAAGTETER